MTLIVHCSDLHFGRVDPLIVRALEEDIRAARPDLVVASGDLTQGARRSEFMAARAFLDRLGAPFLAVPGNHDITPYRLLERFFDPYRRWRDFIHREIEPFWSNEKVVVAGLNSARPHGFTFDWSRGRLNEKQLQRLRVRLGEAPHDLVRIVTAHHPILAPEAARKSTIVGRARLALRHFEDSGVDLVLSGHLHRSFVSRVSNSPPADEIALTAHLPAPGVRLKPVARPGRHLTVLLAASATSTRLRGEGNSYHRIRIGAEGLAIERRTWSAEGWTSQRIPVPGI